MSLLTPSSAALRLSRQLARCRSRVPFRASARSVASFTAQHQAGAISLIQSNVDTSSEEFRENERQMSEAMTRMQDLMRRVQLGGPEKARQKHLARRKMLPRDRVTALIDPGTTFLELSPF